MAALYRERNLNDQVVFDWNVASGAISKDELINLLQCDMMEVIHQLETMPDTEEREVELKKIEFLKVSIVRAKLGREMVSLAFRKENLFDLEGESETPVTCSPRKKGKK